MSGGSVLIRAEMAEGLEQSLNSWLWKVYRGIGLKVEVVAG